MVSKEDFSLSDWLKNWLALRGGNPPKFLANRYPKQKYWSSLCAAFMVQKDNVRSKRWVKFAFASFWCLWIVHRLACSVCRARHFLTLTSPSQSLPRQLTDACRERDRLRTSGNATISFSFIFIIIVIFESVSYLYYCFATCCVRISLLFGNLFFLFFIYPNHLVTRHVPTFKERTSIAHEIFYSFLGFRFLAVINSAAAGADTVNQVSNASRDYVVALFILHLH